MWPVMADRLSCQCHNKPAGPLCSRVQREPALTGAEIPLAAACLLTFAVRRRAALETAARRIGPARPRSAATPGTEIRRRMGPDRRLNPARRMGPLHGRIRHNEGFHGGSAGTERPARQAAHGGSAPLTALRAASVLSAQLIQCTGALTVASLQLSTAPNHVAD
jgi:hypothetical protein